MMRFWKIGAVCVLAAMPAQAAEKAATDFVQEIPGTLVKFEMKAIPGHAAQEDKAIKPFWIGRTEVTWDEYDVYAFRLDLSQDEQAAGVDAKSRPSKPYGAPDRGFGHHNFAALAMTFYSAQGYCDWLTRKTGKKYRLPTEAEWEYAARAGAETPAKTALDEVAWYWDNAEDKAREVASKKANAWGLHDTLGNVWEWFMASESTPEKPIGVVRGGGYLSKAPDVSVEARQTQQPKWNQTDPQNPKSLWWLSDAPFIGFRVVCEGDIEKK